MYAYRDLVTLTPSPKSVYGVYEEEADVDIVHIRSLQEYRNLELVEGLVIELDSVEQLDAFPLLGQACFFVDARNLDADAMARDLVMRATRKLKDWKVSFYTRDGYRALLILYGRYMYHKDLGVEGMRHVIAPLIPGFVIDLLVPQDPIISKLEGVAPPRPMLKALLQQAYEEDPMHFVMILGRYLHTILDGPMSIDQVLKHVYYDTDLAIPPALIQDFAIPRGLGASRSPVSNPPDIKVVHTSDTQLVYPKPAVVELDSLLKLPRLTHTRNIIVRVSLEDMERLGQLSQLRSLCIIVQGVDDMPKTLRDLIRILRMETKMDDQSWKINLHIGSKILTVLVKDDTIASAWALPSSGKLQRRMVPFYTPTCVFDMVRDAMRHIDTPLLDTQKAFLDALPYSDASVGAIMQWLANRIPAAEYRALLEKHIMPYLRVVGIEDIERENMFDVFDTFLGRRVRDIRSELLPFYDLPRI